MFDILAITFPIYAMIALGYMMVRGGVFSRGDMRIFGVFVLNIALPALLFNAVATRPVAEIFDLRYMAVYLGGGLATMAVTYSWFTFKGAGKTRRAVGVMGASSPNSGYVGYPILLLAFPNLADIILALNMLVENFILVPISLILLETSRSQRKNTIARQITNSIINVLKLPMVIALTLGLIVSLSGISIPTSAAKLITMIAASTSALALFAIGGALAGLKLRANHSFAFQISIGKLFVFPALTTLIVFCLPFFGFEGLSPDMRAVVILSSAMPTFGIYSIFAQKYGEEGVASIAQLMATLGAFFTLTALLAILT